MKAQQIQAQFIRKREIEQQRIQQTENLRRYYDRWGKITTQHEHWSSPEFYREAERKLEVQKDNERKQKELAERQQRMREKLAEEKRQFELELKQKKRTFSSKSREAPNNVLESVRQTLSFAEESRSRADLESKLYSRWRLGLDQEDILKNSKSTHQAVAKLSWLDRQIENQLMNEKQKQETHKIELELEQEKRKHESYVQNCQEMRNTEINQLKALQETNIHEHKLRERELHDAKMMENILSKKLGEVLKEIENINSTNAKRRDRVNALHNFRKIKMIMRERSDAVKRDLVQDMNLLDRISFDKDFDNDEEIKYLRQKFLGQHEAEAQNLKYIESMYESEAKEALRKQEDKWNEEAMLREQQLKVLMDDRVQTLNEKITASKRKQNELQNICATHLTAIEDCNQRLKELMSEALSNGINESLLVNSSAVKNVDAASVSSKNINGLVRKTDNLTLNGHHYVLTAPKFGRKKIAWT